MAYPKRNIFLAFIFISSSCLFSLMNCQRKEDADKDIYVSSPQEKLDKYGMYLKNPTKKFNTT